MHVPYTYLLICFVQGACLSFIVLSNVLSRHGQIILCYVLYSTHVFQSVMSRSHASKSFLYNLPSMCFSVSFLQGTVHLPCNQFCARYGTCALPFNQFCARYFTVRVHVPFSFVQGTVHVSYCTVSFVQGTVHVFYCTASFVQGTVLKPFNQFVQGTVHRSSKR